MPEKARVSDQPKTTQSGGAGMMLCRLMWMFIGPLGLAVIIYRTVVQRDGWTSVRDAVYPLILALMIGGRWLEIRSGAAMTATGEPATINHFKRYVVVLLPAAVVVWIAAKVIGNYVLR
jgi:hypothetical protein